MAPKNREQLVSESLEEQNFSILQLKGIVNVSKKVKSLVFIWGKTYYPVG